METADAGDGAAGVIIFGDETPWPNVGDLPVLEYRHVESSKRGGSSISFTSATGLDGRLRLRHLEIGSTPTPLRAISNEGAAVLATRDGEPVWVQSGAGECAPHFIVAGTPEELVEGRSLRAELTRGGLAAFATVEFLRRVTGYAKSVPPPPRACFLFDDPNLHSGRYGFLDYRQLGAHAQDHGYHVAMAMVPLDAWFARRDAARLFRERSEYMSLVMHGNDHMPDELCCGPEELRPRLAQALHRIERLEARVGVHVGRIMVPPHGRWSDDLLDGLAVLGYEGLCTDDPCARAALWSWWPAEPTDAGIARLERRHLDESALERELVVSAYLDQPIILYGHHGDVREGLDRLATWTTVVKKLGNVRWMSPVEMARGNYTSHRDDITTVTLYSSRVTIELSDPETTLQVRIPAAFGRSEKDMLTVAGVRVPLEQRGDELVSAPVVAHGTTVDVRLRRADSFDRRAIGMPTKRMRPLARRLLTESRDRLQPLAAQTRARVTRSDPDLRGDER